MPGRQKCPVLGSPDKRGKGVVIRARKTLMEIKKKEVHITQRWNVGSPQTGTAASSLEVKRNFFFVINQLVNSIYTMVAAVTAMV